MAQNWFAFGNICQTALLFFGGSLWCRSVCICYFLASSMSPHVGSGQNNCGASSQADFIQNYFLRKCMFRKQNFRKKGIFVYKNTILSPFLVHLSVSNFLPLWVNFFLPFPLSVSTSSNPGCQNTIINATLNRISISRAFNWNICQESGTLSTSKTVRKK